MLHDVNDNTFKLNNNKYHQKTWKYKNINQTEILGLIYNKLKTNSDGFNHRLNMTKQLFRKLEYLLV